MIELTIKDYKLTCNTKGDRKILLTKVNDKYGKRVEDLSKDNGIDWFKVTMGEDRGYAEFSNFNLAQVRISAYNDDTVGNIKTEVENDLSIHLVKADY